MALDLEKYRKRLIEERDKLNQGLRIAVEDPAPAPDDLPIQPSDQPVTDELMDVDIEIMDMKSHRLERVLTALQSIDDGTYGTCIVCGEEIDPRRLDADPAALTCIKDAEKESNIETPTM
jgi:RNA polymerase-binding transcription factor